MTRLPKRPRRRASDDDRILPLVNIVFLLLIFFMIAGRLAATDPFEIAPIRSAAEAEPPAAPPLVLFGADGRLALDGEVMDEPALLAAVAARMGEGESEVRLKADGAAAAEDLVRLLAALKATGAKTARLLTVPAGG